MLTEWDWDRIRLCIANLQALRERQSYAGRLSYDQRATVQRLVREINDLLSLT